MCSIHCICTFRTLQCILQVHCTSVWVVLSTTFNVQIWSPNLIAALWLHPFFLWYDNDKGVDSVLAQHGSLYGEVWVRIAPWAREDISCITASNVIFSAVVVAQFSAVKTWHILNVSGCLSIRDLLYRMSWKILTPKCDIWIEKMIFPGR